MKKSHLLLAYLLCIMQTTSHLEANVFNKIAGGVSSAVDYVKDFCSVMGDLGPVDHAVNLAMQGMQNAINSINSGVRAMQKTAIDMNALTSKFDKNTQTLSLHDLHTIIPKAEDTVKNVNSIATDVAYIIVDVGNMAHSIQTNTPQVANAMIEIGGIMHKVAHLTDQKNPESAGIYKDGDKAISLGKKIPTVVNKFYEDFVRVQNEINNGIHMIQTKVTEIMSQAEQPLSQLQHFLSKLNQSDVAALEGMLRSHPYNPKKAGA